MAEKIIRTIADKVLYERSELVDSFDSDLRDLVRDMYDTMYDANGVGLAAVQIGVLKRVLVIDLERSGFIRGTFVNPEIVEQSDELIDSEEGCLSVPGLVANLVRPMSIKIKYFTVFGEPQELFAEDLMARALLHEMDHLDGKVFIDLLEKDRYKAIEDEVEIIRSGYTLSEEKRPAYRSE